MIFNKTRQSRDGYAHPSLKQAFNDAALSSKGLAHVNHCRDIGFPLHVYDSVAEENNVKILGSCTPTKMCILAGQGFRTLVHECRHAFQMVTQGVRADQITSPLPYHIVKRMIEADAAAFTSMVAIERWKSLGYTSPEKLSPEELKDADPEEIIGLAFVGFLGHDHEATLMRAMFDSHYARLQTSAHYESRYLLAAHLLYFRLHSDLSTSKWFPFPNSKARREMIDDFKNPERIISDAAEKLGRVLTMDRNYLSETVPAFNPSDYMQIFAPSSRQFHAARQDQIKKIITDRYTQKR